jgi:hypothetical protein
MSTVLGKYARGYTDNTSTTVGNKVKRTVLEIVRRTMQPSKPIYEVDEESGAKMLRNDLLAKAFLFPTGKER